MNWIDNDHDFARWCTEAQGHDLVAVDTEFVWTQTYYPALGLLQMAWAHGHNAIVDVLSITDTTPLRLLLEHPQVTKVFHEAASDLPILHRWCGAMPRNIADTRLAAGFCGLGSSISLNSLLTSVLGISLAKSETRTDWLQRPLTPAQLAYATEDVDYMPQLYRQLQERLEQLHNTDWFLEEMLTYENMEYYAEPDIEDAWKRLGNYQLLDGRDLNIAVELATWREQHARLFDISRNRIIKDEQIILCAQKHPHTIADLVHKAQLWHKNAERYGNDILECVRRGLALPVNSYQKPVPPQIDRRLLKSRTERLRGLVHKRAAARQIDPLLVGARRNFESLVCAAERGEWPARNRLLNGWRGQLLGEDLEQLIRSNFAN